MRDAYDPPWRFEPHLARGVVSRVCFHDSRCLFRPLLPRFISTRQLARCTRRRDLYISRIRAFHVCPACGSLAQRARSSCIDTTGQQLRRLHTSTMRHGLSLSTLHALAKAFILIFSGSSGPFACPSCRSLATLLPAALPLLPEAITSKLRMFALSGA